MDDVFDHILSLKALLTPPANNRSSDTDINSSRPTYLIGDSCFGRFVRAVTLFIDCSTFDAVYRLYEQIVTYRSREDVPLVGPDGKVT